MFLVLCVCSERVPFPCVRVGCVCVCVLIRLELNSSTPRCVLPEGSDRFDFFSPEC